MHCNQWIKTLKFLGGESMFEDFNETEIRDALELMYAVSYIDQNISDEEIAILACVASIKDVSTKNWRPNLIDIDFVFKRLGEMEYSKIVRVIIFIAQLAMFDGEFSLAEISLLLPLAAEHGLSGNKLKKLVDEALNGENLTDFDKIILYSLVTRAIYIDGVVSKSERDYLLNLKRKYNLPEDFVDLTLVDNFNWVLRMLKSYNKVKLNFMFKEVINVLISDGEFEDSEISFLVMIAKVYGIEDNLPNLLRQCLGVK